MKHVSLESTALSYNPERNALLGQALSTSLFYRALVSGTSRAWLTVGCGMQWLDSSTYLLTCRWSSLRYCGLFPYIFHYCECRINSCPLDFPLWMWLLNQRLEKPSRLGLILKTEDQAEKQGWMPGVGDPRGAFVRMQLLSCYPPTSPFVTASTLLPMPLSRHFRIPSTDLSHLPNVACLSPTNAPSLTRAFPPSPSLPFLLPISLARWIRIILSIYYEQINVAYVAVDRLSPWQHTRKHFKMCFRLIRGTFAALI